MIRITALWAAFLTAAGLIAGVFAASASALPGQCFETPWGGFCDSAAAPDGSFWHCESAMGFSNCFQACHDAVSNRAMPTDMDWNTGC